MQAVQRRLLETLSSRKPSFVDGEKLAEALSGKSEIAGSDREELRQTILRRQRARVEQLKASGVLQ